MNIAFENVRKVYVTVNGTNKKVGKILKSVNSVWQKMYDGIIKCLVIYNANGGGFGSDLAPGLYETGTTNLLYTWNQLIDNGDITVTGSTLSGTQGFQVFPGEENITGDLVIDSSVTIIGKQVFYNKNLITGVVIPTSVVSIEAGAFARVTPNVYYMGSSDEWNNVVIDTSSYIGTNNSTLVNATIIFNYGSYVTETNNVFYENGIIVDGDYFEPSKSYHEFSGWYVDESCTIPFDLTTSKGEVTVYAKWVLESLGDFEYIANNDGTYIITDWKGTLNGVASTECVIPEHSLIKVQF